MLTKLKVPLGGVASPFQFAPQQAMLPSLFTPQVLYEPALTFSKSARQLPVPLS
jgi:hypothetical protein